MSKNYFIKIQEKIKEIVKSTSDDLTMMDIEDAAAKYSFNWWKMKSLKWMTASFLAVITMLLWGCGSSSVTKYYPVYMPAKCSIEIPAKPEYNKDTAVTNLNILAYAEKLLAALKVCTKGDIND